MQIHVVVGLNGPASIDALDANVQRVYPDRHYRLVGKPAWLVADDALARQISEKLGIDAGESGIAGLVTTVANYYGRADPEIWAWMKMMQERPAPLGESASNAVAVGARPDQQFASAAG